MNEKRYYELAEKMDAMSESEKKFALWYLIKDYMTVTDMNIDVTSIEGFRASIVNKEIKNGLEILKELLEYEIF